MCKRNRERMSDTYHRLLDAGKSTALSGDTGKDGRHPTEIKKNIQQSTNIQINAYLCGKRKKEIIILLMKTKLFILCLLLSHSLWGQNPWKIKATDLTPEQIRGIDQSNYDLR